jgi:hypothetical protein
MTTTPQIHEDALPGIDVTAQVVSVNGGTPVGS